MKKVPAIILLVLGNMAAVISASVFITFLSSRFNLPQPIDWAIFCLMCLAVFAALGFASSRIFVYFNKTYALEKCQFVLFSYIPSIALHSISVLVIIMLSNAGFFSGFLGGFTEFIYALISLAMAVLYLISGSIWTACLLSKRKSAKG